MRERPNCDRQKLVCPLAWWADEAAARIKELETEIAGLLQSRSGISDFRDAVMASRDAALARIKELEEDIRALKP